MSILIISNSEEEVVQLHSYFQQIHLTEIHHFMTVDQAIHNLSDMMKPQVDIVIYDVLFTQQTYEDVCCNIALLNEWVTAPILLSTNYDTRNTLEKAFEAGIFDFILKPFDFSHFKARIHIALKFRKEIKLREFQEYNLQKDLALAKKVQKSALTPPLHLEKVQFDAIHITSYTLGGDMYAWFKINDHLTATILYDVMGHGVASSLVSMSIRSLLRGMITHLIDPVYVISDLNRHIYGLFQDEEMDRYLVTAIYILIDTKNNTLHYVNASHPAGILIGKYEETIHLQSTTPILGLFPRIKVNKKTIRLTGWNRIVLYTDGLLKNKEKLDVQQLHDYTNLNNVSFLSEFSRKNNLSKNYHSDDITMVSVTTTL